MDMPKTFDLDKLLVDVFAPQRGERVLVMTDLPHGELNDNQGWADRRAMAAQWQAAFQELGEKSGLDVHPLLEYAATGAHGAPLPEGAEMAGQKVRLDDVLSETNVAVALTEYSATAPLIGSMKTRPDLRAASMPGIMKSMEETALSADYTEVARKSHLLADALDKAVGAKVRFSTGHEVYFDLRHRQPEADDGQLHADKKGVRLINLPSGEACIAPYEGEVEGQPSKTEGMIPAHYDGELVIYRLLQNRIVEVIGDGPKAGEMRGYFAVDEARRNVAELGLGCNDKAVVSGSVLEDEKVLGMHWAYGLSQHIGGVTGPSQFRDPKHVVHQDIVYPKGGSVEIASLVLEHEGGTTEEIIKDAEYTIF
jgi:leucyl aminopeptidase (aminopeptidase T)